ncbi:hypothetical protein Gotur_031179 [Gossypium turneri]
MVEVDTSIGWYYLSYSVQRKKEREINGGYSCLDCNRQVQLLLHRYIITVNVAHDTGNAKFLLFGSKATQILEEEQEDKDGNSFGGLRMGRGRWVPKRKWNLDLFRLWVLENIIRRIVSISPPHLEAGPDRISWLLNLTGVFSIKSAYRLIRESHWNSKEPIWDTPKKFKGPHRVVTSSQSSTFFNSSLLDWLTHNLQSYELLNPMGVSWASLFGIIIWRIWKNKNLFIFQEFTWNVVEIVKKDPLSDNWVRLHIDGEINLTIGLAFVERVVQNHIGILDWLTLLQKRGVDRILIQTDSSEVVQAIQGRNLESSSSALVRRVQKLLQNKEFWVIRHVSREVNYVAD